MTKGIWRLHLQLANSKTSRSANHGSCNSCKRYCSDTCSERIKRKQLCCAVCRFFFMVMLWAICSNLLYHLILMQDNIKDSHNWIVITADNSRYRTAKQYRICSRTPICVQWSGCGSQTSKSYTIFVSLNQAVLLEKIATEQDTICPRRRAFCSIWTQCAKTVGSSAMEPFCATGSARFVHYY